MIGLALFFGGIASLIYYYFVFDTTIAVNIEEIKRVHNIGLMAQRSDGMLFAFISILGGSALMYLGKDSTKGISKTQQRCRYCAELISIKARECRFCGKSAVRLSKSR